jgi:hypothetical protein
MNNHIFCKADFLWNTRFQQLLEYKKANGDCNVPKEYSQNFKLGRWVGRQREAKRKNKLSAERKAKLNAIGFL